MALPFSQAVILSHHQRPDLRAEAAAADVMRSAFDPAYGEAWNAHQLSSFMTMPGVTLTIATLDRANIGFSLTRQIMDEAELMLIATHRSWQKRGIGQMLLQDFISRARKSRIGTLHLEVRDNNPAVKFYMNHGFECIHRRTAYYKGKNGILYDALSLQMTLA
ncbi:MAG: GNAT family N-acetyltransferase [Sphingobium sp.]|nr:GNAT family N-acetyltransferase [Sphingobium sp.]MCP5397708.1 GNAT family N-acetyltransferase [Sphingomonas sp.]